MALEKQDIPCELTERGIVALKEKVTTPLFPVLDGKKEDFKFKYNAEKNYVEVHYKGEFLQYITNEFWAKIVEVPAPNHWDD